MKRGSLAVSSGPAQTTGVIVHGYTTGTRASFIAFLPYLLTYLLAYLFTYESCASIK